MEWWSEQHEKEVETLTNHKVEPFRVAASQELEHRCRCEFRDFWNILSKRDKFGVGVIGPQLHIKASAQPRQAKTRKPQTIPLPPIKS